MCVKCGKSFCKDYSHKKATVGAPKLASLYVGSSPTRVIGDEHGVSGSIVLRKAKSHLRTLPSNLSVTLRYCDPLKFSGQLQFDGKYIAVKGYRKKIPMLWGADYHTHDIPHLLLAPAESYIACLSYFRSLARVGYKLELLICDDNPAIRMAAKKVYPNCVVQLCTKHFRDAMKRDLNIRSCDKYRGFYDLARGIFKSKHDPITFAWETAKLYEALPKLRLKENTKCEYWIGEMLKKREELTNHNFFPNAPDTNNLIEALNSHLQGRLKTVKGFKSFHSARVWLNGYVLKRRTRPFKSCGAKFKHLNGFCSLEKTLKDHTILPNFF